MIAMPFVFSIRPDGFLAARASPNRKAYHQSPAGTIRPNSRIIRIESQPKRIRCMRSIVKPRLLFVVSPLLFIPALPGHAQLGLFSQKQEMDAGRQPRTGSNG